MGAATVMVRDVIASLKSGVLLKGIIRSHSINRSMNVAWIAIEFPVVGEREILVKDEQNLQVGQQVVIECVPNPKKPERHMFRVAEVLMPRPTRSASSLIQWLKNRCQWRVKCRLGAQVASEK